MHPDVPRRTPVIDWEHFVPVVVVVLALCGLGYWLGRRARPAPVTLPDALPDAGPMPVLQPAKPAQATVLRGVGDWAFGNERSTLVGATPVRVLLRSKSGPRMVTISADEPFRVSDSSTVSSARGVYVPGGQPYRWPVPLGPEVELWAVRAGDNSASVSVIAQPVGV